MDSSMDMSLLYEGLLKQIYSIKSNGNSSNFTHGASADVYRNAAQSMWNPDVFEMEDVSRQDAFEYGESTAEITVYLSEAVHHLMDTVKNDQGQRDELEKMYSCALNAKSIEDVNNVISGVYDIMGRLP